MMTNGMTLQFMKLCAVVFFAAVFCSVAAKANNSMAAPVGADLYVQIKPTNVTADDLDRIKALGFAGVRLSVLWHQVERTRGHYSYTEAQSGKMAWDQTTPNRLSYEQLFDELNARNLKALVLLHGGNPLYTGEWQKFFFADTRQPRRLLRAPSSEDEIAAFGRFAANTAEHFNTKYGTDKFIWLIWNEPDLSLFYPPTADPVLFSNLLFKTCEAIRNKVPDVKIAGPGFAQEGFSQEPDYDYIGTMLEKNNVLPCLDYITFHPYRSGDPEDVETEYRQIRRFLEKFQPSKPVPIAVDEWGYSNIAGDKAKTPEIQANRDVRLYLLNQLYDIPFTNIYEWKNFGDDPKSRSENFGLVDLSGRPKAGYDAFSAILRGLKGYSLEKRIFPPTCSANDYILVYSNGVSHKAAIWSVADKPRTIQTAKDGTKMLLPGKVEIVEMSGNEYENAFSCVSGR